MVGRMELGHMDRTETRREGMLRELLVTRFLPSRVLSLHTPIPCSFCRGLRIQYDSRDCFLGSWVPY